MSPVAVLLLLVGLASRRMVQCQLSSAAWGLRHRVQARTDGTATGRRVDRVTSAGCGTGGETARELAASFAAGPFVLKHWK